MVNRGNRREAIFRSDTDRQRFLGRLAEPPERFRTEVHAFVLMDNHYHLLLRTWDANLSEAIRWLQVSYSSVFNRAHRLRGHPFQGRFRSLLIEDQKGAVEVARYLHLNPVRVRGLGLGKSKQRRARMADRRPPIQTQTRSFPALQRPRDRWPTSLWQWLSRRVDPPSSHFMPSTRMGRGVSTTRSK